MRYIDRILAEQEDDAVFVQLLAFATALVGACASAVLLIAG